MSTETVSIRGARTKGTGHYRRPGTRTTYCNRPAGAPNGMFAVLASWRLCTLCVKAEARDLAEATAVAADHTAPAPVVEQAPTTYRTRSTPLDRIRAGLAEAFADVDAALADREAMLAVQMVTEAEADAGTWRGEWIGERPTDGALFDLGPDVEQGALFA